MQGYCDKLKAILGNKRTNLDVSGQASKQGKPKYKKEEGL
jgi:hypothetical protein